MLDNRSFQATVSRSITTPLAPPKSARHFHESPTFRLVSSSTAVDGIHRSNPKIDADHSTMVDYPGLSRSLPRRNLDCVALNSGQHTAEDDFMKG